MPVGVLNRRIVLPAWDFTNVTFVNNVVGCLLTGDAYSLFMARFF